MAVFLVAVKINEVILPFVKELKGNLKKGNVTNKTIERLFNVLNNNWKQTDALTEEINLKNEVKRLKDELLAVNQTLATKSLDADERLKLKDRYNSEHLKVVSLEGKNRQNEGTIRSLKEEIKQLKHLEHNCQALKSNGERCTRTSKTTSNWHGVKIHTCIQHTKLLKGDL